MRNRKNSRLIPFYASIAAVFILGLVIGANAQGTSGVSHDLSEILANGILVDDNNNDIIDNSDNAKDIDDNVVVTSKIADNAVTEVKVDGSEVCTKSNGDGCPKTVVIYQCVAVCGACAVDHPLSLTTTSFCSGNSGACQCAAIPTGYLLPY